MDEADKIYEDKFYSEIRRLTNEVKNELFKIFYIF